MHWGQIVRVCIKARLRNVFVRVETCLLQICIDNSVEHLRWNFFGKTVNGLYPLTIFAKKLHRSCMTICLFATLINLDFIALFFLSIFFWKFQKIHEQLLLKAVKKLEALSEMIRKIHDLKKASAG